MSGIRVVKMLHWEPPYAKRVDTARQQEIGVVAQVNSLRSVNEGIFTATPIIVALCTFLLFIFTGGTLTPQIIFTTMSLFNVMQMTMTKIFPSAIQLTAEVLIACNRLDDLLTQAEVVSPAPLEDAAGAGMASGGTAPTHAIAVNKLCCRWGVKPPSLPLGMATPALDVDTLSDITFSLPSGHLLAVVGEVGSGKSSLLMALLQELKCTSGSVHIRGKVAYVPQDAWIVSGTVRENITLGSEVDEQWYSRVVDACSLRPDFESFERGDHTEVCDVHGGRWPVVGVRVTACVLACVLGVV